MSVTLQVGIASRVFLPEPTAASFRLGAVAEALVADGAKVRVLTSGLPTGTPPQDGVPVREGEIRRFPVLRDKSGYVRGYLPYMSFDIPLFFRLLFGPRFDAVLVEPPPTTGLVTRLACSLRRVPYVWYAADVWSDATEIAGAPRPVVRAVRAMEKFAVRGASGIIAVSDGVKERVVALGARNVRVIPNGIDTDTYKADVSSLSEQELAGLGIDSRYMIYAGTASEWQGARIFAEAMEQVAESEQDLQLVFVGQGSEWGDIRAQAEKLRRVHGRDVIVQLPSAPPEVVARLLVGAEAALVSIVPGQGYDFAYPTKVLAALAAGRRVLFAGVGPAAEDLVRENLGQVSDYQVEAVAEMMRHAPAHDPDQGTHRRSWIMSGRSLKDSGQAAASFVLDVARRARRKRERK